MPGRAYIEEQVDQQAPTSITDIKNIIEQLETTVNNLSTTVNNMQTTVNNMQTDITDIDTSVTDIKNITGEAILTMDYWSAQEDNIALTNLGPTLALPSVTVAGIPAGATIIRAIAIFEYRAIENTSGAGTNRIQSTSYIQVRISTPGPWTNAIMFTTGLFTLAASTREGGSVSIGDLDLSSIVVGNAVYEFQWFDAYSLRANLEFNDMQVGLRILYRIPPTP
jgi:hypothetical protein